MRRAVFICISVLAALSVCGNTERNNKGVIGLRVDAKCDDSLRGASYYIPIEEIAEKIENWCAYQNRMRFGYEYPELGCLPTGESIHISIYVVEGNKILFLPEEKENMDIMLKGEEYRLHYSERYKGYVFYILADWGIDEDGVPLNSLENCNYFNPPISICTVYESEEEFGTGRGYECMLRDLRKLGETEVVFDPDNTIELRKIQTKGNEYIDSLLSGIENIYRDHQEYGTYYVYLETYGRSKVYGSTNGYVTGAVIGDGTEDYFSCRIWDGNSMIDTPFFVANALGNDTPPYLMNQKLLEERPDDYIAGIKERNRGVIRLEVGESMEEKTVAEGRKIGQQVLSIDFRETNKEQAAEWVGYVCSYGEWFGLNELGYQAAELREYYGEKIIMYTWEGSGRVLLFVPESRVNTYVSDGRGGIYPVYVNPNGKAEFYQIMENSSSVGNSAMEFSLFEKTDMSVEYMDDLVKLGDAELVMQELPELNVKKVEEDEHITAFKEHIKDELQQAGLSGEFEIYIGEYESFGSRVCLSAAVTGEEREYYFRYMIVRTENGNYYFWPVGFGLDDSLEECAVDTHYMNAVCSERTKQLDRGRIKIKIG